MPVIVTDYTWTQTESTVYINVPLRGAKAGKPDVLSTDEYLKVNFPPFLFEAFLSEPIDEDRSTAKIGEGVLTLSLPKRTNKLWDNLMLSTKDKAELKEIRERALLKYQEKLAADSKAKAEKRCKEKKYALKTMMKIESDERERIQKLKDDIRERTTAELQAWQRKQREKAEEEERVKSQTAKTNKLEEKNMNGVSGGRNVKVVKRCSTKAESKKKQVDIPAPRACGNIQVSFTPRVFPTALRESRVAEEEEWLKKQAEARRAVNADFEELKDLKEEERNPDWLKEKGDKCFTSGNYLGALNAYNLAIRLNRHIPALYSNRAACHLKLRNLHKAIEDSSKALELMTPAISANAAARARAHVRRGSAFCQLQLYVEGLQDYQVALKISPDDETLRADTHKIREMVQGTAAETGK